MPEKTFKLEVFSPEKTVYGGDVISIVALGTEGSMGILYGHAPLLTELKKGPLKILEPDNKTLHLTLDGGFMEVKQNKVVILTDAGERKG
jgi:F-type H+-transporting ATPase subunit epsilon